ncbi:unnamed protein product [Closterium sp. Naga37s-1]|nr:unnamed protein product [Closterium sp. Naga37s-1]
MSSPAGDAVDSHQGQFLSQSPEVGASGGRRHDDFSASSSGGGGAASTTGAGIGGGAESIAEWKRRSAEAGAHFFPLQRAEDAPSRDELHRQILALSVPLCSSRCMPHSLHPFDLPPLCPFTPFCPSSPQPPSSNHHRMPAPTSVYPYYVNLKLGSQKQKFSMALNLIVPHIFVPCDCLHCGSMRKGTTYSKPFSTLSSTTLKYISCSDQRCQGGVESGFYGCNTEGFNNYLNLTGLLPGNDAFCVYRAQSGSYDYYEADYEAGSYITSLGHVVEDTVYLTAPDGTEVNRSIILGCGMNQQGHWGMQGWQYGSWSAGGVLGLGWNSTFLWQLAGGNSSFAVCLEEPAPTNKTGWDGKVPLQTGSSHLTIGATGLPAGASYATLDYWAGMQYSHITLTTAKRALNITDDPAYIDTNSVPYVPANFPENATPGFLFMPESFVHLLRYPLFMSLCDAPGLLGKYLFLDYTNEIAGWMDAPHCGAEPLLPPPSPPPPPAPVSNGATHSLSPLPAALAAAAVLATSAALLALSLL